MLVSSEEAPGSDCPQVCGGLAARAGQGRPRAWGASATLSCRQPACCLIAKAAWEWDALVVGRWAAVTVGWLIDSL